MEEWQRGIFMNNYIPKNISFLINPIIANVPFMIGGITNKNCGNGAKSKFVMIIGMEIWKIKTAKGFEKLVIRRSVKNDFKWGLVV